jgi:ectoine hydroxylase-related dioxygenase (phytanoyl-CoA dioxygenase family)
MTAEHKVFYDTHGYLPALTVEAPGSERHRRWVAEFDALEEAEQRRAHFSKAAMWSNSADRHFDNRLVLEIATHPGVVQVATALLGPDVLLVATAIFCKYGPRPEYIAPHQDARYWGLTPPEDHVTMWYALDESDAENGAMWVVPKSGHVNRWSARPSFEPHAEDAHPAALNLLSRNQSCGEGGDKTLLPLQPGQMSAHSALTVHGSEPNLSERRRCGVAVHFVPASVRSITGGQWEQYLYTGDSTQWCAVLVAGEDTVGTFGTPKRPAELFAEIDQGRDLIKVSHAKLGDA